MSLLSGADELAGRPVRQLDDLAGTILIPGVHAHQENPHGVVLIAVLPIPVDATDLFCDLGDCLAFCPEPRNEVVREPDNMLNVLSVFRTAEDAVSPFYGSEMLNLLASFEKQLPMTGDQSGATIEFPFPDSIPPTVLVRLLTDVPHPTYGSGVMFLMKLPSLPSGRPSGAALANLLNLAEIDQIESGWVFR